MSLIELVAFFVVLICGITLGALFWGYGGFILAILGFLIGIAGAALTIQAIAYLPLPCNRPVPPPCDICGSKTWAGADARGELIAECACGKRYVLRKRRWEEIK